MVLGRGRGEQARQSSERSAAALRQGGICGRGVPEQSRFDSPATDGAEVPPWLEHPLPAKAAQCGVREAQLFADLLGREIEGHCRNSMKDYLAETFMLYCSILRMPSAAIYFNLPGVSKGLNAVAQVGGITASPNSRTPHSKNATSYFELLCCFLSKTVLLSCHMHKG